MHFHMLFLDGVYIGGSNGQPVRFRRVKTPNTDELTRLTHTIAHRVARYLERQGIIPIVCVTNDNIVVCEALSAD